MARPLRIEFPGALYHVTSRGDGREDIYRGDTDRQAFLTVFGEVCERFSWRRKMGTDPNGTKIRLAALR
jgi:putative transposase